MEAQAQNQLSRAQHQGYQPVLGYRGDWTMTVTPPKGTYPIEHLCHVPNHRRQLQAAAADAAPSAQGFFPAGYSNTNNPFLAAEEVLARSARRSDVAQVAIGAQQTLNKRGQISILPSQQGSNPTQHHEVHYEHSRHQAQELYRLSDPSSLFPSVPEYFDCPDSAMSLTYETSHQFLPEANYPRMHDPQEQDEEIQHEHPRYPSPPLASAELNSYTHHGLDTAPEDAIENLPQLQANSTDAPSPGRSKPIPKPDREVTKGDNGRYICTWVGCTEEVRDFGRKCEWSKHMDKHDRPYKCPADGCEKLPGFTYSGGLLRHEREVHGKHGGPRKQLNCPHLNCKRHTGKGFSRQENLNEHLRRVHTSPGDGVPLDGGETEEDGEDTKVGVKRKRGPVRGGGDDIREELKRLRAENDELRRHSEAQTAQTAEMMAQIRQLQSAVVAHPRMPNAPM